MRDFEYDLRLHTPKLNKNVDLRHDRVDVTLSHMYLSYLHPSFAHTHTNTQNVSVGNIQAFLIYNVIHQTLDKIPRIKFLSKSKEE